MNKDDNYKMISLDISTSCTGYAIWINGVYSSSGVLYRDIKSDELKNIIIMGENILDLLSKEQPDHIVIEDTFCGKRMLSSKALDRLHGIVISYAISNPFTSIDYINVLHWRKLLDFPSNPTLSKLGIQNKTKYLKSLSIERAKRYKASLSDDNEADAINIGDAFLLSFSQ